LCVGEMVAERGLVVHGLAGEPLDIQEAGFDHFK
jgi:hypothetical protein